MKKKSIIGLLISFLGLGLTTTSCEDMLTPEMDRYAEGFSGRDTVNFYFGILTNLQDVVENNVLLGDIRSDLIDTTGYVSDTVAALANFDKVENGDNGLLDRAAYYKVINQCNYYLAAVDTTAQKNNIYYMRREFAQVQMIRAWTYMQLVQNYGQVPFISVPVSNAGTGWETNPEEGWATPDNLLDLLNKAGLKQAYEYEQTYGTPIYGSLQNGNTTIDARLCVFPGDVIMGDLYLLRGRDKSDFVSAASYYYKYIDEQNEKNSRMVTGTPSISRDGVEPNYVYSVGVSSWMSFADKGASPSYGSEVVTLIPSAANNSFGTVLSRGANIYGFSTSSSNSTTTDATEGTTSTSGNVTVTADYKSRQIAASRRFQKLAASQYQAACFTTSNSNTPTSNRDADVARVEYWPCGDARYVGSVYLVNTTVGEVPFVHKRASVSASSTYSGNQYISRTSTGSFSFNYTYPVYRMRQIYLRYAEAVNRAGFPRYAFAILRDGLSEETIPTVRTDSVDENNRITPYVVSAGNGADIDVNELRRAENITWLDFSESRWNDQIGVHATGCMTGFDIDTLYCYNNMVAQRIADEQARVNGLSETATASLARKIKARLKAEEGVVEGSDEGADTGDDADAGDDEEEVVEPEEAADPVGPSAEEINAVETLIADEMALETAYEGYRYYDLLRIARHKNNDVWGFTGADYGTQWFAWTVARRSVNLAPYEQPRVYNTSMYNRLLNIDNWYLQNPQY